MVSRAESDRVCELFAFEVLVMHLLDASILALNFWCCGSREEEGRKEEEEGRRKVKGKESCGTEAATL